MKNKSIEKLFNLVYTDSMTGVKNGAAFDELRKELNKYGNSLEKICAISVIFEDYDMVSRVFGNATCDDAIREIACCLTEVLGEKADIYRTAKNEFMCIARKSLFGEIIKVGNALRKIKEEKIYPFDPIVSCSKFHKKLHKNFDDFLIYCDERATH